jgi:hypothetical protein
MNMGRRTHGRFAHDMPIKPRTRRITRGSIIRQIHYHARYFTPELLVRKRYSYGEPYLVEQLLSGCYDGRHFEVLVKFPGEQVTIREHEYLQEWRNAGAIVGIAHSAEEFYQLFNLGIKIRAS